MDFTLETIEARAAIGVRVETTMATIGDDIGRLSAQIAQAAGAHAAGAVCARYHAWDGQGGELEILVPVSTAPADGGDAQPSELPACRAAVVWHEGPYPGLHATWQALGAWMKENGHEGSAAPWEEYVSDCTVTPPEELRTKIVWPI